LTHQRLFSNTALEFARFLDEEDLENLKILDRSDQEFLIREFSQKPIRPSVFFKEKFNEKVYSVFRPRLDKILDEILPKLKNKPLFEMGKDGNPTFRPLEIAEKPATILFHFRRNEVGTRYFPTIKYLDSRIEFMFKEAEVICGFPAWMSLNGRLYNFDGGLDGKKLTPFLNKRYIEIPRSSEREYFRKFVLPLIEKHSVYAEGFDIHTIKPEGKPLLKVNPEAYGLSYVSLLIKYNEYEFSVGQGSSVSVQLIEKDNKFSFIRIIRSLNWEKEKVRDLENLGLKAFDSSFFTLVQEPEPGGEPPQEKNILYWINQNYEELMRLGFQIAQTGNGKIYFMGHQKINLEIKETGDWFDILGNVQFGPYSIPFLELKNHILNNIKEFTLPSGEIALIPDKWFFDLGSLFMVGEGVKDLRLKRIFAGLIHQYSENSLAKITLTEKLGKILDFESIESENIPRGFKGKLRDYQKAGYDWFCFLKTYRFGGCLADDMGLGKTIQTLAFLQKIKEENGDHPGISLIIVPTSLIHNWVSESTRFTPDLRVYVHTGGDRMKDPQGIPHCDVFLTTYGITRIDQKLLEKLFFHYIILDESQNIKNPYSRIAQVVRGLKSQNRLILSGTPLENSLMDLWSQMTFLNPGLLGSQSYFMDQFQVPIEKKGDQDRLLRLKSLIKPFILRRTKQQVASELPPRTEQVIYSDMIPAQEEFYEKNRSFYRLELLKMIDAKGLQKSRIAVLQGISRLRQIANHPRMVDLDYEDSSGKFMDVLELLENTLEEGHKVLIFSSFTKHLAIIRSHLEKSGTPFAYLDGGTKNRSEVVKNFRENEAIRVFLISIKAGGVGLNLVEADYVFILDPWWNPAVEKQAIDRTHRIGQNKNVFIYKFITKNSVEEKILALQGKKLQLTESMISIDPSFTKDLSLSDIKAILD
jgi:superfamily II DNA or RNA helicase